MLNITNNRVKGKVDHSDFESLHEVIGKSSGNVFLKLSYFFFFMGLILIFLPWTQNIRSIGYVTALDPSKRPQTIQSAIAGRIEEWHVQEGDFVNKGDTILFISDIKDEYFDPQLLLRTEQQIKAKEFTINSYQSKVSALENQIKALKENNLLRLEQARNKLVQAQLQVTSDSISYKAADINYKIAKEQYLRFESLYKDGLKSKTDLENRELVMQKREAELIGSENKLLHSRNNVLNAQVELKSIEADFQNSIAKAESEKFSALSNMYDSEAMVTKLMNQYTNYSVRRGMYYITAPQSGFITKAISFGIGETIKEGQEIISIMPADYELAVEMYINPLDLPLVVKGQKVRIQFDGWPAIIFSGWPNVSYGTYGGVVVAIDNFISEKGKYRLLIVQDRDDHEWPDALRVGAGTNNMILLKDVPIWYELWRQFNGFPPDYYKPYKNQSENK